MTTVTVHLKDSLEKSLLEEAHARGLSYAEVLADAYKRMTMMRRIEQLRSKMVPRAVELGLMSDEDVFRFLEQDEKL